MSYPESVLDFFTKMKDIQISLLNFLNNEEQEGFEQIIDLINNQKISEDKDKIKELIYLISNISNNHHRTAHFISKVEKIIKYLEVEIKSNFSNYSIFNIFKNNKRLLLFLFESRIIIPDKSIYNIIINDKYQKNYLYPQYFYPEFESFFDEDLKNEIKKQLPQDFENDRELFNKKRRIGENDLTICQLIRNDSLDEFIEYINNNKFSLETTLEQSIFETNQLLLKTVFDLIHYAAFFGSNKIFEYLSNHGVRTMGSVLYYAIHSNNMEMLHDVSNNKKFYNEDIIDNCIIESIKCHNIDITNYLFEKFHIAINGADFHYHNYIVILNHSMNFELFNNFYSLCKYDYVHVMKFLLENRDFIKKIDINLIVESESKKTKAIRKPYTVYDIIVKEEKTALNIAIEKCNLDIVNILLKQPKINVNEKSIKTTTSTLNRDEYTIYIGNGDKTEIKEEKTALNIAIEKCNLDIVNLLLKQPNINVNEKSIKATTSTLFKDYERLRRRNSFPRVEDGTEEKEEKPALNIAIEKCNLEIVDLLLKQKNIDINNKSIKSSTKISTEEKRINISYTYQGKTYADDVKIEKSKTEEKEEKPALNIAIEKCNFDIVNLLLKQQNININIKSIKTTKTEQETENNRCTNFYHANSNDKKIDYNCGREIIFHMFSYN